MTVGTVTFIDGEEKTTAFYTETESLVPVSGADKCGAAHFVSCVEDSIVTVGNRKWEKKRLTIV